MVSLKRYLSLIFLLLSFAAGAQLTPAENTQPAKPETPSDSLGRRTPRGTVDGFLKAMSDQNYQRASQYLDLKRSLRNKPKERERIVKTLQHLLDSGGSILPTGLISDKYSGKTDDDLEEGLDAVGSVTADGQVLNLMLENTQAAAAPPIWRFSRETVDGISNVTISENLLIEKVLPRVLEVRTLAGVPVGHWLAAIVIMLISYLVSWGIISLIIFMMAKAWRLANKPHIAEGINAFNLPVRLYMAVWMFVIISQQAGISIIIRQRFSTITVTIGIIAILILLWRLSDVISTYTKNRMTVRKRISAISVILFLRRSAKVAIVLFGIIAILGVIGVDVQTYIAALGIGGIALALGAQKTVENLVGSVTLVTDQPIRVGDFCKVGDVSGTVEAIGMRSTRLRTGARTVVTIPNGALAATNIENFAHRDRFLFSPTFQFRLDTTPDQIRFLLVELRAILYAHPCVNPDPAKIRFTGFGESSVKIEVWAYIEAAGFDQFQEVQEDILLRMMDVIEQSGTSLTVPAQTIFIGRDKGVSEEKAQQSADKVNNWKENHELQLPSFDTRKIDELKGSIKYPPEGSVKAED
ncbi:mechanosensitive ion channel family protein [Flavobacterium sp. J372]|uniref:mechanosensitive ion channel family protein n=1 Tax=Flavobacterium sp. J372 TaxID=2898436 RepID=UPI002151A04B|nr:mechanosensitive ion channel family protein [Flavobacterium sp. J372]MCR5862373.1 mechanosensitive ion channel family protein [Flavobacterium sp. J372]